jgi:hypothetical protein
MTFKIDDFLSNINGQKEIAKAYRFDVQFVKMPTAPGIMKISDGARGLSLLCENAELPGITVSPIEFLNYGVPQKIPGNISFQPISLTFICTGKMQERIFFDSWVNSIIPISNGLLIYPDDNNSQSKATIKINQYSGAGDLQYSVMLEEAFPISIEPMALNWGSDEALRLNVAFAYRKWYSSGAEKVGGTTTPNNLNQATEPPPNVSFQPPTNIQQPQQYGPDAGAGSLG